MLLKADRRFENFFTYQYDMIKNKTNDDIVKSNIKEIQIL